MKKIWLQLLLQRGFLEDEREMGMKDYFKELNIEAVSSVVPCCFVVMRTTPEFPLLYANDLFLDMLGYADFETLKTRIDGKMIHFVAPEDREKVRESLQNGKRSEIIENTHRIICSDGMINYAKLRFRYLTLSDDSEIVFAFYFNVDQYEQKAHKEEQKMRKAMCGLKTAVWECMFKERKNVYTPETVRDFKIPLVMENVPESLIASGTLHPDSAEKLKSMYCSHVRRTVCRRGGCNSS